MPFGSWDWRLLSCPGAGARAHVLRERESVSTGHAAEPVADAARQRAAVERRVERFLFRHARRRLLLDGTQQAAVRLLGGHPQGVDQVIGRAKRVGGKLAAFGARHGTPSYRQALL